MEWAASSGRQPAGRAAQVCETVLRLSES
jgi:hypothetical protein